MRMRLRVYSSTEYDKYCTVIVGFIWLVACTSQNNSHLFFNLLQTESPVQCLTFYTKWRESVPLVSLCSTCQREKV